MQKGIKIITFLKFAFRANAVNMLAAEMYYKQLTEEFELDY